MRRSHLPSRCGEKLETHLQEKTIPPGPPARQQQCHLGSGGHCGVTTRVHTGHRPLAQTQQSQDTGEGVRPGQRHGGESPHPTRALSLQNDWTETRVRVLCGTELFTIKKLLKVSIASRLRSTRASVMPPAGTLLTVSVHLHTLTQQPRERESPALIL